MAAEDTWKSIGTVVGNASTSEFTFILKSFQSRVGDIVTVRMEVPDGNYSSRDVIYVWGRVTNITRYNPFFPYEAAHELSNEGISLADTILSNSRDQLEAQVLILGCTNESDFRNLFPLTYPVQPAADVFYPPAAAIKELLAGGISDHTPARIGTLIARSDVGVEISADRLVARHMAILAMTGGGKSVAARRIIRELIDVGYPLLIFDPHGDYLGLWQRREKFENTTVKLFYPHMVMTAGNERIVEVLISKMTDGLTEPQRDFLVRLLNSEEPETGQTVLSYIEAILKIAESIHYKKLNGGGTKKDKGKKDADSSVPAGAATINAVRRALVNVRDRLRHMETTNERMRARMKHLSFEKLPDPSGRPEGIIKPRQVSILYLGGYDHLTQCTIVSIVMEALFEKRASLSDEVAPFMAVLEEAHNFIPSSHEGATEAPSLPTIRKVITEGRKFGTGLLLISQRPSRLDETILSQCNSFLILRLVNPRDQNFVRAIMENLSDADARMLPGFGAGQGIISGQAVRFPLLVRIDMDKDLLHSGIGDENFIQQAEEWQPGEHAESKQRSADAAAKLSKLSRRARK